MINLDIQNLDVEGRGTLYLEQCLSMVLGTNDTAAGFKIVQNVDRTWMSEEQIVFGMVVTPYSMHLKEEGYTPFVTGMPAHHLALAVAAWLEAKDTIYPPIPDSDGDVVKGWRVSIYNYSTILIEPWWIVWGK